MNKMKRTLPLLSLSLIALLLQSCGFGYSINEKYTPLEAEQAVVSCKQVPDKVTLLFEGEKIDFEYEKQGMIEVQGDRFATDAELLERLKKLAKSKCCDVIINLKKNYVNRESGLLFTSEPTDQYSAITYFGLAVKRKSGPETASLSN